MPAWLYLAAWPLLGFLLGSIPFGYIVARARGVDIRTLGSGNIGMTNVWRTLGWKAGATVLVLDVLKGMLPILLIPLYGHVLPGSALVSVAEWLSDPSRAGLQHHWHLVLAMLAGLAAVLGHTFTPWLRFKGGKGIATGAGVLIALLGLWSLVPVGVFALALLSTRMVSVASLLAAYSAAAVSIAVPELRLLTVLTLPLAVFVTWTHRDNIARIRAGTERRIGSPKHDS